MFPKHKESDMEDKLLAALKRAIAALNTVPNFVTPEGIKSYALLSELDALVRDASSKKK